MNYGCLGMWHFRVVVSLMIAVCCTRLFANVVLCDLDVECIGSPHHHSNTSNLTESGSRMMVFTFID